MPNETFIKGTKVEELYSVGGDLTLFEMSNLNSDFKEWFVEGVTREEIVDIYNRLGYRLQDIEARIEDHTK